ncbi:hypothetical protein [Actinomadura hibisca]|uniref:hypothetical protein n=1 Tax=Actinomadura hibisca TaxID=68565 RepID=UPI00082BDB11|nr:hypothetical protein [Actinomadura hibisca]
MPTATWLTVAMSFAGLLVLAFCGFKVHLGVRRLARELDRTRRRLEPEQTALRSELHDLQEAHAARDSGDGVRSG